MNVRTVKQGINLKKGFMPRVLLDSAFLGQGLPMVSKEELTAKIGCFPQVGVVWLVGGEIQVAEVVDFLNCPKDQSWQRLDSAKLSGGFNGYCTGSVTMDVAGHLKIGFVATAGIGGVDRQGKACSDILALAAYHGLLVATAPKDILDLTATIDAWRALKVPLYGWERGQAADGFLFSGEPVALDGIFQPGISREQGLLLCPIRHEWRLQNSNILNACLKIADRTPIGESPHPAVNAYLAEVTGGLTSRLQLDALCHNIRVALQLAAGPEAGR